MHTRKPFGKTEQDFNSLAEYEAALKAHEQAEDAAEAAFNASNSGGSNAQSNSELELVRGVFTIERNASGAREIVFTGKLADGTDFAIGRVSSTEKSWTLAAVRKALMKSPNVEVDAYVRKPNAYTTNFQFQGVTEDSLRFDLGYDDEALVALKKTVVALQGATLGQQESRSTFMQVQRERQARFK